MVTDRYYDDKLSADRLKKVYQIAPVRVQQYLEAEIDHVLRHVHNSDIVLELGCGYGRVMRKLAAASKMVVGVDTSWPSLKLAKQELLHLPNQKLCLMNAAMLGFRANVFDITICIQNGISAFKVNQTELIREAVRVTRPGGIILFSSYSDKFWNDRLEWFRLQSEAGLLGEIDSEKTGDGTIICKDGFKATTLRPEDFMNLTSRLGLKADIIEVGNSSLFCEINLQR